MTAVCLKFRPLLQTATTYSTCKQFCYKLRSLWDRKPKEDPWPNVASSSLGFDKSELTKTQQIKELSKKYIALPTGTMSPDVWLAFEREALTSIKGVNSTNFDGLVMKSFTIDRQYDIGASFLDYVSTVRKPNDIVLAHFMILAADYRKESKVLETYSKINKSLLIVPTMTHLVVRALSKTSKWKECVELLRALDEISLPALIEISAAAFRNDETNLGRQLIKEVMESGLEPNTFVFNQWLQVIISLGHHNEAEWLTSEFFTCLRRTEHILTLENAMLLKQLLTRRYFPKVAAVHIDGTGCCPSCQRPLERPELTAEEHADLLQAMEQRLNRGSTTYLESHPQELQVFLKFLKSSAPYDIVVDGLNIAHRQQDKNSRSLAQMLLDVVTLLCEQGMKPIVLCKKHMWFWSPGHMQKVEHKAKCFYADNISADDPFMIYAALYGGPKTLVMTSDMMRDHYFLLEENRMKELFRTWTISRQIGLHKSNKIVFFPHQKFGLYAQGSWEEGWHIPYQQNEPYKYHVAFHVQKLHWLCTPAKTNKNQPLQKQKQQHKQQRTSAERSNKG